MIGETESWDEWYKGQSVTEDDFRDNRKQGKVNSESQKSLFSVLRYKHAENFSLQRKKVTWKDLKILTSHSLENEGKIKANIKKSKV